jgi:anti-anti-sigma regulatory factor
MTSTDEAPDPARVPLEGVLTVRSAVTTRATLLEAITRNSIVHADCGAAESVDLSLIQLLLSARRSACEAGKRLSLAAPAAGALRVALEQGGFLPPSGSDPFWSGEP